MNKETDPDEDHKEDEDKKETVKTDAQKVSILKEKLTDEVNKNIEESVFLALVQADEDELKIAKDSTITAVNNVMSSRIAASDVENAKKKVVEELGYMSISGDMKKPPLPLRVRQSFRMYFSIRTKPRNSEGKRLKAWSQSGSFKVDHR